MFSVVIFFSMGYLFICIAYVQDLNQKVRDLRRTLEELRYEKEIADIKAMRVSELDILVQELQTTNKNLESRIAHLCETPFINEAFSQQQLQLKYQETLHQIEDYKVKMNHLQEAVKTHYSALTSLKQQASAWREEKSELERKFEEAKMRYLFIIYTHIIFVYFYVFSFFSLCM